MRRIEGQIRGIANMIDEQRYCIDILQQIKAVKSALASVEINIIDSHVDHCVRKMVSSKNESESRVVLDEIRELLKRSVK